MAYVTIRDVARRAGISVSTVSRALNETGRISPQTKAAVERAVEELHYIPDSRAKAMGIKAAVAANPQADAAWIDWGVLEGRAENWAESERLLRHAVELRPQGAKGWQNLAVCLERQGRTEEAAQAAARAAALLAPYGSANP